MVCTPKDDCHDIGACDPLTTECTMPRKPDGTPCEDEYFCTVGETCTAGVCGNGTLRNCNDGNLCSADLCDDDMDRCVHNPLAPCCGNALVDEGEGCDAGLENADTPNATCRTDCTPARCGDRIVDDERGESCDLGPEASDEPDAPCRTDCRARRCGDGVVDPERSEQCDDGNVKAGDGCSPRCFWEPTVAATMVDGVGNQKTECVITWRAEGAGGAKGENPTPRRKCTDGDATCDHDGATNGECTFHVWLCSNNTEPEDLPCRPGVGRNGVGTVAIAQVRKPSARHATRRSVDAGNHRALLGAAAAAAVGNNLDVCGPQLDIRVPVKTADRRGSRSIRVKATTNRNVIDADSLKLICVSSEPPTPGAPILEAEGSPPGTPPRLAPIRALTQEDPPANDGGTDAPEEPEPTADPGSAPSP